LYADRYQDQDLASIGVLHLLQALTAGRKETTLPPRLWLVTSGVHAVEEQDRTTALTQASVWGLGRVVVYEHPDLHTTLIDIEGVSPTGEPSKALFEELWSDEEADEVVLRGDRRYVARLTHQTLPDEQEPSLPLFHENGTYLITGGLGGVGLRTAQWMIEQGARHLVLMGRHGATEETLLTVQALRNTGADVSIIRADVTQEEQLASALAEIRHRLPPLRGVFHSAVVLDDSILLQLDRERFLSVMPPKVDGTWNLHHLTLDDPLDYFVLFSSAASLIGSPGQGNYAAASAFMDMLAHYRKQHGYPALTINWGRWGEVGQATKEKRGERLDARGFAIMKPKDALTILGKLLRQSSLQRPQIGVMSFNLPQWSQFYPKLLSSSLFVRLLKETETQEGNHVAKGPRLTREMLTELDEQQRLEKLSPHLSDQIARILGHTSLNLDAHQQLIRLGIDSLMSVELKNRLASDLNVVIPVAAILQGITFGELTKQILEQVEPYTTIQGCVEEVSIAKCV
jgi:acyl carrier protein